MQGSKPANAYINLSLENVFVGLAILLVGHALRRRKGAPSGCTACGLRSVLSGGGGLVQQVLGSVEVLQQDQSFGLHGMNDKKEDN